MDDLSARTAAMAAFIKDEVSRTNAPRVLGIGYSNGANILASVGLTQPDLVDELILLHPLIPWAPAPQPDLKGRRILVTAGEMDPICPAPMTRALIDYLTAQGAEVTQLWHPGGHEIRPEEVDAIRAFIS
jgi:phospholipase/carboxylesterase